MGTRFFYAHHNKYGIGMICEYANGRRDRWPGQVARFTTKADRDAWVADDEWDGNYHREPMPAAAVRAEIERDQRAGGRPTWESTDPLTGAQIGHEILTF